MVKPKQKNQWKPVDIDGIIFSEKNEGLIGLEVCDDYDLNLIGKTKKNKKRTLPDEVESDDEAEEVKLEKRTKKSKIHFNDQNEVIFPCSPSKSGSTTNIKQKQSPYRSKLPVRVSSSKNQKKSGKNKSSKNEQKDEGDVLVEQDMSAWEIVPLQKTIVQGLAQQGFVEPTKIQSLTLPAAILGKRDILGAAETGSGKTLAFGLPILYGILKSREIVEERPQPLEEDSSGSESDDEDSDISSDSDFDECECEIHGVTSDECGCGCVKSIDKVEVPTATSETPFFALILTPTRELAIQITNHIKAVARYTGIQVAAVVGGMAAVKQERLLSKGPEIVVATPGRFWELYQQGNEHLQQLGDIKYLAIDETDRMLERGHFQELHDILEKVNIDAVKRKARQNFVFSATLTLIHELPTHLVTKGKLKMKKNVKDLTPAEKLRKIVSALGITEPKVVDISDGKGTPLTLTECRITCPLEEKDYYVYYFVKRHPGRTLIFCNSIGCVKRLATLLGLLECHPLPLHATMHQRQRLKNLDRFRDNDESILIATDVAARGLDIPSVQHVLHYQTPRTSENYVHRSGRTARASMEGLTVLFVEPSELPSYLKLCRTLGKSEDIPHFPVQENYLNAVKERVNLARELDRMDLVVRKASNEVGWFQKAAADMDIIIDDDSLQYDITEANSSKKEIAARRSQLSALLKKPIFPKGLSGNYPLITNTLRVLENNAKPERAVDIVKNQIKATQPVLKKPKSVFSAKIKAVNKFINAKELIETDKKKHSHQKLKSKGSKRSRHDNK